jgi:very-long-chain (3R)-3-hydroxyacyl-CoA dehydratase
MVLSWAMTEVVRYSFYACSMVGMTVSALLYLRYTMFYILYPTGAFSEAFLIYAALPAYSPFSWLHGMWKPTDYVRAGLFIIWWPSNYTH